MSDDYLWLSDPIHKNLLKRFLKDYSPLEDEAVKESLQISFDGSIMAVAKEKVSEFLKDKETQMMRMGFLEPPKKADKITDDESFYKFLSLYVEV